VAITILLPIELRQKSNFALQDDIMCNSEMENVGIKIYGIHRTPSKSRSALGRFVFLY
jgi:hypothetical protein